MSSRIAKISTIVRFMALALPLMLGACAGAPQLGAAAQICTDRAPLICTAFSADSRCACVTRTEVEGFLGGFGSAAWPGAIE